MSTSSPATDRRRLLRIYLNDHLMGAEVGIRVAGRCLDNNRGGPLGTFLQDLQTEITEDRDALKDLMDAMEFPVDRVKVAAGIVAERIGRLKLNGRLTGYSDLSRLEELEGLHAGVNAKLRLWKSLQRVASADPHIEPETIERLIGRAESQLERLEEHRLQAAERALG
ncbi:MAG TPA: hypothetical protein VM287_13910 [Egibacteraceae bacterium]|nr:hypothetical protein [Egibacteraceae bacterium]